jgi:hypothetical protein
MGRSILDYSYSHILRGSKSTIFGGTPPCIDISQHCGALTHEREQTNKQQINARANKHQTNNAASIMRDAPTLSAMTLKEFKHY